MSDYHIPSSPNIVMTRIALTLAAVASAGQRGLAHGFGGSGILHPLTGPDHMLAMVAVGAWSAQIGGRALVAVPATFVAAMAAGSVPGMLGWRVPGVEFAVALSVVAMGAAIVLHTRMACSVATAGTVCFGLAHGYAHGLEMPRSEHQLLYVLGFLVTTAGLHVVGAVAGLLLLEQRRGGLTLRLTGAATAFAGLVLVN